MDSNHLIPSCYLADEEKLDQVYLETERNRQMLTQILLRTVDHQNFDLRSREIDLQVKMLSTIIFLKSSKFFWDGNLTFKWAFMSSSKFLKEFVDNTCTFRSTEMWFYLLKCYKKNWRRYTVVYGKQSQRKVLRKIVILLVFPRNGTLLEVSM